jgi:hypothetical protein
MTMKCKGCGTTQDVVKYGQGLLYRGYPVSPGLWCHDCVRKWKEKLPTRNPVICETGGHHACGCDYCMPDATAEGREM